MRRLVVAGLCLVVLAFGAPLAARQAGSDDPGATARVVETRAQVKSRQDEEGRLTKRYAGLVSARDATAQRLGRLLAALWPLRLATLTPKGAGDDWAEADRRYVWSRALFEKARISQDAYARQRVEAAAGGQARDAAAERLRRERREAGEAYAALVSRRVEAIERQKTSQTADAAQALGTALGDIERSVGPAHTRDAPAPSGAGRLSRPVSGPIAGGFAPSGHPPRQGLLLEAPEDSEVVAAASGQVDFSGVLRGLGHVVILSHEGDLRTVYACLASSDVAVGDSVSRERPVGRSGYCGSSRQPGVYFELRFREKALNPAEWFAARR